MSARLVREMKPQPDAVPAGARASAARTVKKSRKLDDVCYDIRGPVLERARQLEEDGHQIIKLNIGNLATFGFDAPETSDELYVYNKDDYRNKE